MKFLISMTPRATFVGAVLSGGFWVAVVVAVYVRAFAQVQAL